MPPLRDRLEDLPPLAQHLLDKLGARLGLPGCTISPEAMTTLAQYPWPGNVRELENVIERALVLGSGIAIGLEDLPDRLTQAPTSTECRAPGCRLIDVERDHIRRTLETVGGNKAAAARALDVNRKTLYRKLRQHRLI